LTKIGPKTKSYFKGNVPEFPFCPLSSHYATIVDWGVDEELLLCLLFFIVIFSV